MSKDLSSRQGITSYCFCPFSCNFICPLPLFSGVRPLQTSSFCDNPPLINSNLVCLCPHKYVKCHATLVFSPFLLTFLFWEEEGWRGHCTLCFAQYGAVLGEPFHPLLVAHPSLVDWQARAAAILTMTNAGGRTCNCQKSESFVHFYLGSLLSALSTFASLFPLLPHGWYCATTLVDPSLYLAIPKPTFLEFFQTNCNSTQVSADITWQLSSFDNLMKSIGSTGCRISDRVQNHPIE